MAGNLANLHTASYYAPSPQNLVGSKKSQQELQSLYLQVYLELKDRELEFYRRFGYDSADAFYQGVKSIMAAAGTDLKILQRMSTNRLRQLLKRYSKNIESIFGTQPFVLSLKLEKDNFEDKLKEIQKELQSIKGGNETIHYEVISADRINIGMTWNINVVKKIISATQKKYFHSDSNDPKALMAYMRNSPAELIKVYEGTDIKNPTIDFKLRASPFNYSKDELNNYNLKEDKTKLLEIQKEIINFIFQDIGVLSGSTEFRDSTYTVLNQILSNKLTNISFFTGGTDRWVDNVVGAMGEFQAAIFFNYIARKCPNKNLANEITEIIGNKIGSTGQMPHSDLQILEAFGIQVKNYGSATFGNYERTIDVKLHPMEVAPIMKDMHLVSYIINSYFNQSVEQISENEWNEFFEQNAIEILNLEIPSLVPTHITIPSKVSFYLVGGHLIPGSEIVSRAFGGKTGKDLITVTTSTSMQEGYTDVGYVADQVNGHPRFIEWWRGHTPNWIPTEQNKLETWDKNLSIRASFTYKAIWDLDTFKIF